MFLNYFLASHFALGDQQQINLATEYVNPSKEILFLPTDIIIFKASTCNRYDSGFNVNVKIDLPLNPNASLDIGVVLFTVSNKLINAVSTLHHFLMF